MVKLLVGGLGGGDDVIASLATAFYLESLGFETVMAGIHKWSAEAVTGGIKLSEALIQVDSSLRSSKRIPEIAVAETLNRKTYLVLMGSRVDKAENAFKTLFESENIEGAVLVDAGGDSLVRGDEAQLGSPFTDHPVAAALVRASRSASVKTATSRRATLGKPSLEKLAECLNACHPSCLRYTIWQLKASLGRDILASYTLRERST